MIRPRFPTPRTAGGRAWLTALLLASLAARAADSAELRWWPVQEAPQAVVRTDLGLMAEIAEPGGRKPNVWLGQEHMLVESVAGLAAQAVNQKRGDELVWIEPRRKDYPLWYQSLTNRLRLPDRGLFKPWQLVQRFARRGIVKGYILYTYDPSSGHPMHFRSDTDESANVATSLAGLLGGVLVSEGLEPQAKRAGLKLLFDARGKTAAWCFGTYRDQLSRHFALLQSPQVPHCRDIAIAHRMMVMFGTNSPIPEVYAWLRPLSSVLGWNGADEAAAVKPLSRAGHILLPCNWSMNLSTLSAGSDHWDGGGQFHSFDPRRIKFNDRSHAVSFIMSDGDNVQWLMGSFCTHPDYWASPDNGHFPLGWGAAIGCLDQCSPDTLAYLKHTQRPDSTLNLHAGGYFYPDLLGLNRPPEVRRRILTEHARRVSHYLKRSGCRTYQFITMDLDSREAHEAYRVFARELTALLGMFALQYHPYEGGDGKVFWVDNGRGDPIPVVTAKFSIWGNGSSPHPRAGTPAKIARAINEAARAAAATNGTLNAWCVTHAWSGFRKIPDNDEQAEDTGPGQTAARAVTPTRWCVDRLDPAVRVVSPEELLWRIRLARAPEATRRAMAEWPLARWTLEPDFK